MHGVAKGGAGEREEFPEKEGFPFSIHHFSLFLIFHLDECLVRVVSWIVLLSWLALVASDVTTIHGAHRGLQREK